MNFAPILIFAYNRPSHFLQVLTALVKNAESIKSDLIIFCDGPKNNDLSSDMVLVRKIANKIDGFKSVKVIERSANLGLANSIISGVTEFLKIYDSVIVLEDDIVVSQYFLKYINEALDLYKSNVNVASIHAYVYPVAKDLPNTFFLRGADCWGWATWRRAWQYFEADGTKLLNEIQKKKLNNKFDYNGQAKYTEMLIDQINGRNNSWAVRWYASAFLRNMVTLYPGKSLITNIGLDGSGVHCADGGEPFNDSFSATPVLVAPINVKHNTYAYKLFVRFFKSTNNQINEIMFFGIIISIVKKITKLGLRVLKKIKRVFFSKKKSISASIEQNGWYGNYESWEAASLDCSGYDTEEIFNKVLYASRKVRDGEAVFERDSVLFDHIEYSWPITAYLLKAGIENNSCLNVLDFGGALGSHYYQNKSFIDSFKVCNWIVVEQSKFVEYGKAEFKNDNLNFASTIGEAMSICKYNVVLMSSVIPYLEDYKSVLNQAIKMEANYLLLDRTFMGEKNRITIQKTPAAIYEGSYPSWVLSEDTLFSIIAGKYELVYEFVANDGILGPGIISKGYIWKKKAEK